MWTVCITSISHVLKLNGYGGPQAKVNGKSQRFKGWETLVALLPEFCFFVFICIRLFVRNNAAKFLTNRALERILNCQYWHYIAILHF